VNAAVGEAHLAPAVAMLLLLLLHLRGVTHGVSAVDGD
jgi:hypothetical protein